MLPQVAGQTVTWKTTEAGSMASEDSEGPTIAYRRSFQKSSLVLNCYKDPLSQLQRNGHVPKGVRTFQCINF